MASECNLQHNVHLDFTDVSQAAGLESLSDIPSLMPVGNGAVGPVDPTRTTYHNQCLLSAGIRVMSDQPFFTPKDVKTARNIEALHQLPVGLTTRNFYGKFLDGMAGQPDTSMEGDRGPTI